MSACSDAAVQHYMNFRSAAQSLTAHVEQSHSINGHILTATVTHAENASTHGNISSICALVMHSNGKKW